MKNQHPHPQPELLLEPHRPLPQKSRRRMIQHPQSESPLNRLLPHPLPLPQKDRRRIIQRMLHPHPLLLFVAHPQDVAVKSLISYLQGYLFYLCYIICRKACMCFSCTIKFFMLFLLIEKTCCSNEMQRDEGG